MKARVGEKGQVTIPKPILYALGIGVGTELEFEERDGGVYARPLRPHDPLRRLKGIAGRGVDVDRLLSEMRGPAWRPDRDAGKKK